VTDDLGIGEFARRCGLSPSALRFYDECGLLKPAGTDPANGYRQYGTEQVAIAVLIRDLRGLGMAIGAIRVVLDQPAAIRHKVVDERIGELEMSLVGARRLARTIHHNIDDLEADMTAVTVEGNELATAMRQVLPAVGTDPRRALLQGVLFEWKAGSLRLVATDSYRMTVRDLVPRSGEPDGFRVVVPGMALSGVAEWVAEQPSVAISESGGGMAMRAGDDERVLETIDGEYPDYEVIMAVVPETDPLIVGREALADILEVPSSEGVVEFAFHPGELVVTADGRIDRLGATYEGEARMVTLNGGYALDAVTAAVGPEVAIEATGPTDPVVFRSADDGALMTWLMPIRKR